jgi:hypothetical protein
LTALGIADTEVAIQTIDQFKNFDAMDAWIKKLGIKNP